VNELGLIVLGLAARATGLVLAGLAAVALVRRRGPSAGALASSTTLAVLVVVAALAPMPWPRWRLPGEVRQARPTPSETSAAKVSDRPLPNSVGNPTPSGSTFTAVSATWSDFAREFNRELLRPTDRAGSSTWRWPAWLAVGFLAGLAVGLMRLCLGVWAVQTLRRRSQLIDESSMLELVAKLRADMSLSRPVELRETFEVGTPATVGWRRPAILLPKGWGEWDESERLAVLAHELAHVVRGDYLIGLAAQFSLSLHFYHPLVHALARRLRLQQELAADAWGAQLSGGRRAYLTALANLALRQDPRSPTWPARPFLPTRGTFLRRIEMLRDPNALQQSPLLARGRAVIVGGMVLIGLLVAGLRGPGGSTLAQDAPVARTSPPGAQAPKLLDPITASSDAHLVIEIRPSALLKNPDFKKVAERIPTDGPKILGMLIAGQIEQVIVLGFDRQHPGPHDLPPQFAVVLRSNGPIDWKPLLPIGAAEVKDDDGFTFFRSGPRGSLTCSRVLDDRTLLIGTEADVKLPPIGPDRSKGRHGWDNAWSKLEPSPIRMAFDTPWLVSNIGPPRPQGQRGAFSPISSMFGPLLDKVQAYALSLDLANGLTLEARATCDSEQGASRVSDTVRACIALGRNALPDLRQMVERGPAEAARPLNDLLDALDVMLETSKVDLDMSLVKLHAQADASSVSMAVRLLLPAVGASREAARRAQCSNNMKQIGLAMFNYYEVNKCFPPAVLYGPDGKTPYSWRVALLPYLEQNPLYSQYKFDEPWDGPNNSKLIPLMPFTFRCPDDDNAGRSHHCSYFVLTGPETIFPVRKQGTKMQEVTDGTSNTILVVEARRDVPWTKPEDIPYAADKPVPTLGGFHPNGFNAGMADGAARFIKDSINENTLRALISRAAGEVISFDQL
jgi:Protein of unknown function (DUF1559)/BlaR1 peptidase M56